MYKFSKFNYFVKNDKEELILYNSNKGLKSLSKISKEKVGTFDLILKNESFIQELDKKILEKLIKKGIVIESNLDEDLLRKFYKYKYIFDNNLNLIILPTQQCNFRCVYCYENFKNGNMNLKTQDAIIDYVSKNITKYNSLSISWFGGEPTLAIKEIEYISSALIDICKKAKKPYYSNITTNGYLLNEENVSKLVKCKVYTYQITVDGIKETHNLQKPHITSNHTFDTVLDNLINMKNNVKTKLLNVIIRTNISEKIYNILDEYIDFYYDRFNDDKRFSFFIRPVGDWGGNTIKNFSDNLITQDKFKKIYNKILSNEKTLNFTMIGFLDKYSSSCYANRLNSYVIDSQGVIRKCTCSLDDEKYNKVGMINSEGRIELDDFKLAKWISFEDKNVCSNCFNYLNCLGSGCNLGNNFNDQNKPSCPYEKLYMDETLILADKYQEFEKIF